jgi:RHS repeat-associated protein
MATDRLPTTTTAAADLTYAYDAGDMRVRKAATDAAGITAYTLYPSAALEERRCSWSESAQDYTNDASHEVPQLNAHGVRLGRVSYEAAAPGVPAAGSELPPGQHVFLSLSDHLGSTSTVIDLATSEVVEKRTSRAYGGVESDQRDARWGGAKDEKAFTGKEEDEEVGLTYFGARYLSSQLGRWVSADPLAVHSLGADANVYAYVHGGVLRAVDPVGLADVYSSASPGKMTRGSDGVYSIPQINIVWDAKVPDGGGEVLSSRPDLREHWESGVRDECHCADIYSKTPATPPAPPPPTRENDPGLSVGEVLAATASLAGPNTTGWALRTGGVGERRPDWAQSQGVRQAQAVNKFTGDVLDNGLFATTIIADVVGAGLTAVARGIAGKFIGKAAESLAKPAVPKFIPPTVKQLRASGIPRGFQVHHLLPEYLGKMLGYTTKEMESHPGQMIAQWTHTGKSNPKAYHKIISQYLPVGKGVTYTAAEIRAGLKAAYTDLGQPALFDAIEALIK